MAPDEPLIRVDKVARSFEGGRIMAVREASLAVAAGERLAIVGQSGSGKSSLLAMMCGIDRPDAGAVFWRGQPVMGAAQWSALRASEIGIVFQDFLLLPALTALQNVLCALSPEASRAERRDAALALLARVGLADRADHRPGELSGGERQRVAVARSLANRPSLLLADEPTGALDSGTAARIMDLMLDLQDERRHALVIVTHDEAIAARCERRVRMRDGAIVPEAR